MRKVCSRGTWKGYGNDSVQEMRREQKKMNREMNRITHAFGEEQKLEIELAQREIFRKR